MATYYLNCSTGGVGGAGVVSWIPTIGGTDKVLMCNRSTDTIFWLSFDDGIPVGVSVLTIKINHGRNELAGSNMTTYLDLSIDKGTTFENIIRITNPLTNNVVNIAGYTVRSKMRRSYYGTNSTTILCSIIDAANGVIKMSLDAANTGNLIPGKYVYDVETINVSSFVARQQEGRVIVYPEATY